MHDHADIVEMLIDDYGVDVHKKIKNVELVEIAQLYKKKQVLNLLIEKYGCKIKLSPLTMEVRMYVCVQYVYIILSNILLISYVLRISLSTSNFNF